MWLEVITGIILGTIKVGWIHFTIISPDSQDFQYKNIKEKTLKLNGS